MASNGKCFTFLWKLENISCSLQKKGKWIVSPAFTIDEIDRTKWRLHLYPRGETDGYHIGYFLSREPDSEGARTVQIQYELSLLAKDGSVLSSNGSPKNYFVKDSGFGIIKFVKREDVFTLRRSVFLPEDTLTACCRIWKVVGSMTKDVRCTALTRIGIEKKNIKWSVKNFSLLSEKKCTHHIKSTVNDATLMTVDLQLTEGLNSEGIIRFELFLKDRTIKFSALKLFLIDDTGNRVECNHEEIWFDDPATCKQLTFSLTKKKLMEKGNIYLPEDTLTLLWEWVFSKGVVSEEIEEDEHGCICPEIKISDAQNVNTDKITLFNGLVNNMQSLYDENFLSDVKLKTGSSTFPAHKFILSAVSSVFKAMFSRDMKEKDGDCVNIEYLSDDTVNRMLLFIYTTRVEDISWESASRLYVAADKYAILSLKNVCSSYLKDNLTSSNACEALLLSDLHSDEDLKSSVQDYVLKNGKQITNSEEWKDLMETNSMLAAETLCQLFK